MGLHDRTLLLAALNSTLLCAPCHSFLSVEILTYLSEDFVFDKHSLRVVDICALATLQEGPWKSAGDPLAVPVTPAASLTVTRLAEFPKIHSHTQAVPMTSSSDKTFLLSPNPSFFKKMYNFLIDFYSSPQASKPKPKHHQTQPPKE